MYFVYRARSICCASLIDYILYECDKYQRLSTDWRIAIYPSSWLKSWFSVAHLLPVITNQFQKLVLENRLHEYHNRRYFDCGLSLFYLIFFFTNFFYRLSIRKCFISTAVSIPSHIRVRVDDKIPVDNPIEMAIMEGNEGILWGVAVTHANTV